MEADSPRKLLVECSQKSWGCGIPWKEISSGERGGRWGQHGMWSEAGVLPEPLQNGHLQGLSLLAARIGTPSNVHY